MHKILLACINFAVGLSVSVNNYKQFISHSCFKITKTYEFINLCHINVSKITKTYVVYIFINLFVQILIDELSIYYA